jgi:transposase
MGVAIGVDSHKSSLAAAGVDELGRSLGAREFANTPAGHQRLLRWTRAVGEARVIGVEGSGIYGAGLVGFLLLAGEDVREYRPHSPTASDDARRLRASPMSWTRSPSPGSWPERRSCRRRSGQSSLPTSSPLRLP